MTIIQDRRRLRVSQIRIVDGEPASGHAAEVRQREDGMVDVSGLWEGVIPMSPEDMKIRASRVGVSSLEWLRKRLLMSPLIKVEILD
jgi:hypothetical protein